ncbi:MAG: histidinol-phosphatase [Rhodobacteraceae bacterium]|nr:MAG: histidinol-phosphatase [Paracoccaceae bacterium]
MDDNARDIDDERLAAAIADAVRAIPSRWFRKPLAVDAKADRSPVTEADRAIEQIIRARLSEARPEDGVLGEEFGAAMEGRSRVWVVDPIDGTGSFITGSPLFGTLIGLLDGGVPVLGLIDMPLLGERWSARRGAGTTLNGAPCRVSGCGRLADAALGSTSPLKFEGAAEAAFRQVAAAARITRFGGDCYTYGLLAAGHLDAILEVGLEPYDYLPLVPVIEEAGGVITDWRGAPLGFASDGRVLAAATEALHAEIMEMLET